MISVHFQGKTFNITVIQMYSLTSNAEEAEVEGSMKTYKTFWNYAQNICSFHYRGLECKSRKSRYTWSNRQLWLGSTKWSRSKVNRVLRRECTGHSKYPLPTTEEKTLHMDITRWSILKLDWLYSLQPKMEKFYKANKNKTRSWLWHRSWNPYYKILNEIEESRENH